jgi:RNA polymerase sigma-70 factor (ECF subfamily)
VIAERREPDPRQRHRHPTHELIAEASVILRRALVARNGLERGCEAAAEAIAWAWEHRDELADMENPLGYLYRVGQSSLRRGYRLDRLRVDLLPDSIVHDGREYGDVDEALFNAIRRLTPDQRVAVVMVHMYGFSYREVAELTEASESAVTNYVHRGMNRLRVLLAAMPTEGSEER